MAPLVLITLLPSIESCSGATIKSKWFKFTFGSWIWILKTFLLAVFFKCIDGITLLRPQDIMTSKSSWLIFLNTLCETGLRFGGINFQKWFS